MGKRFAQRETKCSLICLRTPRKRSDRPQGAFQMSDISLLAMSRTDQHLSRTKLTSDVSRPVRAESDFFFHLQHFFPLNDGLFPPRKEVLVS